MPDAPRYPSDITQRTLKWAIFLGVTAVVVYLCVRILAPFMNVIAWSIVLAVTFHPVHEYLVRRTGKVSLSALIASALVVVAFLIPLLFIAGLAIDPLVALGDSLQETLAKRAVSIRRHRLAGHTSG
jgi:predicted PurR-regulated permease PerM